MIDLNQGVQLAEAGHHEYDEGIYIDAGASVGEDTLNLAYLSGIGFTLGNAYTNAISLNALITCDTEYAAGEITGGGVGPYSVSVLYA